MTRLSLPALAAAAIVALLPGSGSALANGCAQIAQIAETSNPPGPAVQDEDEEPSKEVAEAE